MEERKEKAAEECMSKVKEYWTKKNQEDFESFCKAAGAMPAHSGIKRSFLLPKNEDVNVNDRLGFDLFKSNEKGGGWVTINLNIHADNNEELLKALEAAWRLLGDRAWADSEEYPPPKGTSFP